MRLRLGRGDGGERARATPRRTRGLGTLVLALRLLPLGLAACIGSLPAQDALPVPDPDAAAAPMVVAPDPDRDSTAEASSAQTESAEAFRAEVVAETGVTRRLARDDDLRTVARQGAVVLRAPPSSTGAPGVEVVIDARASELLARLGVLQAGDLLAADPARVARALRLDVEDWARLRQSYADSLQ